MSLAGPGESGKSTIFKQMKIISMGGGFTDHEQKAFRFIIYGNCITQMKVLVGAVEKLGLSYDSPNNEVRSSFSACTLPHSPDVSSLSELGFSADRAPRHRRRVV